MMIESVASHQESDFALIFFSSLFLILNIFRNLQLKIRFGFRDSAEVDLAEVLTGHCRSFY